MMTLRQRDLLKFIDQYIIDHKGVCPTYDEMAAALGLKSKSSAYRLVNALEERGFIQRLHGRQRAIEVIHRPVDRVKEINAEMLEALQRWRNEAHTSDNDLCELADAAIAKAKGES